MKKAGLSNLAYPTLLLDGSLRFNFSPHLVWRHFLLIFYGLAEKTVERAFSDAAINTHFMAKSVDHILQIITLVI